MNDIERFKKIFDPYIKKYLDKKIQNVSKYTNDYLILDYISYIKTIILSGGKRIRSFIAFLMYQALGGKKEKKTLHLLVSLEIFHTFCLVHDDIMDKATLRHGTITVHKYVTNKLQREKTINNINHVGNSQAILIGDLLFSWSQEILNLNTQFDQTIMHKIKMLFYQMIDEVCVGQMIDIDITTRRNIAKKLIDEKTYLKTAGYSFIKPLQIGASLTNKYTNGIDEFCKEFGTRLGIAFQMQDDLFDKIHSTKQLGKTSSLDKSQNQHSYFTYFKSLEEGKKIIENNFNEAKDLIKNFSIKDDAKKKFLNLVELIQTRTY